MGPVFRMAVCGGCLISALVVVGIYVRFELAFFEIIFIGCRDRKAVGFLMVVGVGFVVESG